MTSLDTRLSQMSITTSQLSFGVPTWYHNLPMVILVKIFKSFNERELLSQIVPVCKKWKSAALQPELWKTFEASGKNVPTYFICQKIRNFFNLTAVRLNEMSEPVVIIRQVSRCLPNLKQFALRNSGTIPELCLRNFIQCCKQLELVDLSGTRFKSNRFYQEIAGLINLKSINFSKNKFFNVHNLLTVVLNCHKLEELKISSFTPAKPEKPLRDEDVLFIVTNLAPGLKSLSLDASNLTNFSFKAIMQCKKLEKLGLYGARNLSPDMFLRIANHLQDLQILKIRDAHLLTGTNLAELFSCGRSAMENLTSIDFTGCWKITDIGVKAIAHCCVKLEYLRLKSCKSVKNLRPVRDNCFKLLILNIAFCTSLDPYTILPLPEQMKMLIIDKNKQFEPIMQDVKKEKLVIKMCVSEYTTDKDDYKSEELEATLY